MLFQAYDKHLAQLTDVAQRVCHALEVARINYRIVGGLAVLYYVRQRDPLAARLTRDVDIAVDRADLPRITDAVRPVGLEYRHVAGVDMLIDAKEPKVRSGVHLVFVGEKVRPHYLEPVPDFSESVNVEGIAVTSVSDLVTMKLTSFRPRDKAHLIDMDSVGLITPDIEATLSGQLRDRLHQVREEERQSTGAE